MVDVCIHMIGEWPRISPVSLKTASAEWMNHLCVCSAFILMCWYTLEKNLTLAKSRGSNVIPENDRCPRLCGKTIGLSMLTYWFIFADRRFSSSKCRQSNVLASTPHRERERMKWKFWQTRQLFQNGYAARWCRLRDISRIKWVNTDGSNACENWQICVTGLLKYHAISLT